MLLSFDVLKEHIADGRKGDANKCAVALALMAAGYTRVGVFNGSLNFTDADGVLWQNPGIPYELADFILYYDQGLPLRLSSYPFTLNMDKKVAWGK